MKKPTFKEVVTSIVILIIFAGLVLLMKHAIDDCERRHGVLIRSISGYECVAVERR